MGGQWQRAQQGSQGLLSKDVFEVSGCEPPSSALQGFPLADLRARQNNPVRELSPSRLCAYQPAAVNGTSTGRNFKALSAPDSHQAIVLLKASDNSLENSVLHERACSSPASASDAMRGRRGQHVNRACRRALLQLISSHHSFGYRRPCSLMW